MTPSVSLCHGSYGARIIISFPRGASVYELLPAYEQVMKFMSSDSEEVAISSTELPVSISEHNPESEPDAPCTDEALIRPDWPESGFVTADEICRYWNLGKSTFRNRVREGVLSPAAECGRADNAPKVWSAAVIGSDLLKAGFVRRAF